MTGKRERDPSQSTYYRSDRISCVNGQYYFSTREGTLEGPFFSRDQAEREIDRYILRQQQALELLKRSGPPL